MFRVLRFLIPFTFVINCAATLPSQELYASFKQTTVNGSLAELTNKHRVWLIVGRSVLLDASGKTNSVLSDVYKDGNGGRGFPRTYNVIAKKLNKYMRDYGSISAAQSISEADFIIYFNILEIRKPLGIPYAYGELFVILNRIEHPRILWKTKDDGMFAEDAVKALVSDLKATRGER